MIGILLLSCSACGKSSNEATTIRIGVTATANEPAVALTAQVEKRLKDAVDKGVTAVFLYQPSGGSTVKSDSADFSVRRGSDLENDPRLRDDGFSKNMDLLKESLAQAADASGRLDALAVLADMARVPGPAVLVLRSSGLQSAGALDLTKHGLDIDVESTIAALPPDTLPDLAEKTIIFSGLGQVAGRQAKLPEPKRQAVAKLWMGVCQKFHAASCASDDEQVSVEKPLSTTEVPVVEVSAVTNAVVPGRSGAPPVHVLHLPSAVLFEPNTDRLAPGAGDVLREIVPRFTAATRASVIGHTATFGARDTAVGLSRLRSERVVSELVSLGVDRSVFTTVTGVGYDEPIEPDVDGAGNLIPASAEKNRAVVIEYSTGG